MLFSPVNFSNFAQTTPFCTQHHEIAEDITPHHVQFSPDGNFLLTTHGRQCSLHEINQGNFDQEPSKDVWNSLFSIRENDVIHDTCWNPRMTSSDPNSCFFLSVSRNSSIHSWSALTGKSLSTYTAFNHLEQMETLNSICFSPDGTKIYAGSNKSIRCFTTEKPGKVCLQSKTFEKGVGGIKNVISTMAISPSSPTLLACGSYDGKVGLFSLEGRYMQMTPLTNDGSQPQPKGRDGCHCTLLLQGHSHTLKQKPTPAADAVVGQAPKARKIPCGVTQVQFTRNGMFLFSGARRNKRICCWDIRNTKRCLFSVERECRTNQRVLFDITPDDRLLATASQDGTVKLFDISQGGAEAGVIECGEVTNAVSFHPTRPLIAVTTGQHRFGIPSFSPLQDRPPLRFQSSSDNSSDSSSGLDREHMLKDDEGEQRVRFSPSDEEAEAEHAVPVSPFPITPFQRPVVKRGTPPIPSKNNLLLFQVTMTQTPQQPQTETPQQPPAETPCASIETLYQTPAEQPQQPSAEQPQQPPAETPCAPVEAPSTSDT